MIPLGEVSRVVGLRDTEGRMVVSKRWERGKGWLFNGYRVSVYKIKTSGDYTTMCIHVSLLTDL